MGDDNCTGRGDVYFSPIKSKIEKQRFSRVKSDLIYLRDVTMIPKM
jgi:hypothetical protein